MFFLKSKPKTKIDYDELLNKANVSINFSLLESAGYTPFSVERHHHLDESQEETVVSCIDKNGRSVDFYYSCSKKQHNAVVADFIEFGKKKYKK